MADTQSSRYLAEEQSSQEHATAQRYRDTLRILDDGCQACNMSKVYCDAIWYSFNRARCGMCGHP